MFEVTTTTLGNSFALRPCEESTELMLGVIGRGLERYPTVRIHALNPISSHFTGLISASEPKEISGFVGYIKNNISREIRRLHKLPYSVFEKRRASILPVSPDQASEEKRFRYAMSQGTKEDLVDTPRDWPGVTGVHALEQGELLSGWWFDRTAESRASRRGETFGKYDHATKYEFALHPLPSWCDMSEREWRDRVTSIVEEIIATHRARRASDSKSVLGVDAVKAFSPTYMPDKVEKTRSPLVLAASKKAYDALRRVFHDFCELFWQQSRRLREDPEADVEFPPYSFPPGRPMTGGPAPSIELALALEPG